MAEPAGQPEPLFFEAGASWSWLLFGPVSALVMVFIGYWTGAGFQPLIPLMFLVLVTGFLGIQVKAARIHTVVELTPQSLREGTEILPVDQIVAVCPDPEDGRRGPKQKWQEARSLGELSEIPRGRTPLGLKLTQDRYVQAWARDAAGLRAALTELIESRA